MPLQPPAVIYPDAELVVISAMRAALVVQGEFDVYVSRSVPSTKRPRMVILTRDGGQPGEFRDIARIRVRVFDASDKAATDLARLVCALVPTLPGILRGRVLSGPYEVPDESGPMRYALTEIHLRGEAL